MESGQNLEINMTAGVLKNTGNTESTPVVKQSGIRLGPFLEAGGIKPLFIKRIKERP